MKSETRFLLIMLVVVACIGGVMAVTNYMARRPAMPTPVKGTQEWVEGVNRPTLGPANAPVTLIIFSDFQCPTCKRAADEVRDLSKRYDKELKVVFRHFPLTIAHANAKLFSESAEAAYLQGKFWEMHDLLFSDQMANPDELKRHAQALGLNMAQFEADRRGLAREAVEEDIKTARELGIDATPSIIIYHKGEGQRLRLFTQIEPAIKEALAADKKAR